MRTEGRLKLGFFPLPVGKRPIRKQLLFSDKHCRVVDPCVGAGAALLQVTRGATTSLYGIELDAAGPQTRAKRYSHYSSQRHGY